MPSTGRPRGLCAYRDHERCDVVERPVLDVRAVLHQRLRHRLRIRTRRHLHRRADQIKQM